MKIEHCEYSKDNGQDNDGNVIWYCARRTFCPYEKCEVPAQNFEVFNQAVKSLQDAPKESKFDYAHFVGGKNAHEVIFNKINKLISEECITATECCRKINISLATMRKIEKEFGVKFEFDKKNIKWEQYDPEIKEKLKKGIKLSVICKDMGFSIATVYNHLNKNGEYKKLKR